MTSISPNRHSLPSRSPDRTRIVSAVLAAGGLTMLVAPRWVVRHLVAPRWVVRHLSPGPAAPRSWIVRLLGARSLVQHGLLLAAPTRAAVRVGAAVDGLHAASMMPVVARWPRFRRAAGISGGFAAVSAAAQLAVAPPSEDAPRIPGDVPPPEPHGRHCPGPPSARHAARRPATPRTAPLSRGPVVERPG